MSKARDITISFSTPEDRQEIYRLRHKVYASELRQHSENQDGLLRDSIDEYNLYIAAKIGGRIIGFISITPPNKKMYSIDKYFARTGLPFCFDDTLYEVRLLTVIDTHRGHKIGGLLMYSAFRWIEERGGEQIVAIGRSEIIGLYIKAGLEPLGKRVASGAVNFELLRGKVNLIRCRLSRYDKELQKLENRTDWKLHVPFCKKQGCFHGGVFFKTVGEEFDKLEKSREIINADVLDAWFPPSPKVISTLQEYFSWLLRTSPPVNCEGMIKVIARVRGLDPACILPGAGSSSLIFLAFRKWLKASSRVLILDPTYGEYSYICEKVIGCRVDRINLSRSKGYIFNPCDLNAYLKNNYDLIVLVNPNNPTGCHIPKQELKNVLQRVPERTLVWLDEAYIEYVGRGESLEHFAAQSINIIVCKSMSKCYALSGIRVAYLCGPSRIIKDLSRITPPWAVSLPAQVAAVMAVQDQEYYAQRYKETVLLREELAEELNKLNGLATIPATANFILCHFPSNGIEAAVLINDCRKYGLFLRDVSSMGTRIDVYAFRIAVKDKETNKRMVEIIRRVLSG